MEVVPPLSLDTTAKLPNQELCFANLPMAECTPNPLSLCNTCINMQPHSLCARRGLEQLQIHAPPYTVPNLSNVSGNTMDLASPSTCCSSSPPLLLETLTKSSWKGDEPRSPSAGNFTMAAWGYEMGALLGVGSMASVYKVTRHSDRKEFAAKCVPAAEMEQVRELRREYEILKMLDHGCVVRATEMYARHSDAWLCMELCRGGSIEDRIKEHGVFSDHIVVQLARQLLEGANYLARKRVVHRDIKPMNLLLLQEEPTQLKIADFNAAKQLGCRTGCTVMLSARGTQLYAAPELRFGLQWNERVDVWACGLCIFGMLRARHPFPSATHQHICALQQGRLPSVDWGDISKPMCNLVKQCLTVDMRDRPVPMELLEHCVFSTSNKAALGGAAVGWHVVGLANTAATECHGPASLVTCCLLMMQRKDDLDCPKPLQQSRLPCTHAMQKLAKRRYQRLEGEVSQSNVAWTSPI